MLLITCHFAIKFMPFFLPFFHSYFDVLSSWVERHIFHKKSCHLLPFFYLYPPLINCQSSACIDAD